jgi:hypothetical protein
MEREQELMYYVAIKTRDNHWQVAPSLSLADVESTDVGVLFFGPGAEANAEAYAAWRAEQEAAGLRVIGLRKARKLGLKSRRQNGNGRAAVEPDLTNGAAKNGALKNGSA